MPDGLGCCLVRDPGTPDTQAESADVVVVMSPGPALGQPSVALQSARCGWRAIIIGVSWRQEKSTSRAATLDTEPCGDEASTSALEG